MGNTEKENRKFKTDGLTDPKTNQDYNKLKPDPSDPNPGSELIKRKIDVLGIYSHFAAPLQKPIE
jgi:hypothetical protein